MHERRNEPRREADWPVFLRSSDGKKKIGGVADISLSGIKVVLNDSVEIGDAEGTYDLYLCSIQSPMDLMNITGHAVWHSQSDRSLTIGLELEHLDEKIRSMLKEYIEHQDDLALQMDLEL